MGPLIAIVGRPNVGKSSLFNKLIGEDIALIADLPGLTRDRNYSSCKINNSDYILVDTGGITESSSKFDKLILLQALTNSLTVRVILSSETLFLICFSARVTSICKSSFLTSAGSLLISILFNSIKFFKKFFSHLKVFNMFLTGITV